MKILIFTHEFPPAGGGAGVVALQNAEVLSRKGYKVTVLTKKIKKPRIIKDRKFNLIEVYVIPKLWFFNYSRAVNFEDYDCILLNDIAAIYTAGRFFDKKLLKKCLCFLHGSEPEIIFENPKLLKKIIGFKESFCRAIELCSLVVCPSKYMIKKYYERTFCSTDKEKFVVSYAGLDETLFLPEKQEIIRNKLNISNEQYVLVSVCRIVKGKGLDDKLNIFQEALRYTNKDLFWVVVGDGEYRNEFEKKIKDKNLEEHVYLAGFISRSELRFYYSAADLFWLMTNYDESFGLVYLEAQACGVPALGPNKAGIKEAVEHGVTGFLVENNKEALEVIVQKSSKKLSEENLICFSRSFSVENIGSVINSFCNRKG